MGNPLSRKSPEGGLLNNNLNMSQRALAAKAANGLTLGYTNRSSDLPLLSTPVTTSRYHVQFSIPQYRKHNSETGRSSVDGHQDG